MRVSAVLESLPGVGKARAAKIMERLEISPTRRVRGLGANQRKALETELNAKLTTAEATIRARTEAAMGNVRSIAGEAASAIVERLTGQAPDSATLDRALDATAH